MQIEISKNSERVIWRAMKHRKEILGFDVTFEVMLGVILREYDRELDMIKSDLTIELLNKEKKNE